MFGFICSFIISFLHKIFEVFNIVFFHFSVIFFIFIDKKNIVYSFLLVFSEYKLSYFSSLGLGTKLGFEKSSNSKASSSEGGDGGGISSTKHFNYTIRIDI